LRRNPHVRERLPIAVAQTVRNLAKAAVGLQPDALQSRVEGLPERVRRPWVAEIVAIERNEVVGVMLGVRSDFLNINLVKKLKEVRKFRRQPVDDRVIVWRIIFEKHVLPAD